MLVHLKVNLTCIQRSWLLESLSQKDFFRWAFLIAITKLQQQLDNCQLNKKNQTYDFIFFRNHFLVY